MKPICCDTSFLFALYGSDVHTPNANALLHKFRRPITLSVFNEFELENSLRFAVWRQIVGPAQMNTSLAGFAADVQAGHLVIAPCNLAQVVTEARRLSADHTADAGHRAFDILHVAAALHLGAGNFLSFDANQRRLAAKCKLKLNP